MTKKLKSFLAEVLPRSLSLTVDWVNGLMTSAHCCANMGIRHFSFSSAMCAALRKYDVLLPPPPEPSYWERARTHGGDYVWAFNQYVVPPGYLGHIADSNLLQEFLDAYRRFRLPQGTEEDSHQSILDWILARLNALQQALLYWRWEDDIQKDLAYHHRCQLEETKGGIGGAAIQARRDRRLATLRAKQKQQQEILHQLQAQHPDSLLLGGLDGLMRDHISFSVLQITVACQAFKGVDDRNLRKEVEDCMQRWCAAEHALWKLRFQVHRRAFRNKELLERHLWLSLAALTADTELRLFPEQAGQRSCADDSPAHFSECIIKENLSEGPPSISYDEVNRHYLVDCFQLATLLTRAKADLHHGASVVSAVLLPEIAQRAPALQPLRFFRVPGRLWRDQVPETEPLLHSVCFEHFFRRIHKLHKDCPPRHVLYLRSDGLAMNRWWALVRYLPRPELPRELLMSSPGLPSRAPLPEQWHDVLVKLKIQDQEPEIEDLVNRVAPPCMRQLRSASTLNYDQRFAYGHLYGMTGLSGEYIYRMREALTVAQYRNRPHAESEIRRCYKQICATAKDERYGWRCATLHDKGMCPVRLNHEACAAQTPALGPGLAQRAADKLAHWPPDKIRPLKKLLLAFELSSADNASGHVHDRVDCRKKG